ncbi:hypothetical protein [Halomonas denitrificans]|nr:hypothetical protein [Halomonas denitrificans]
MKVQRRFLLSADSLRLIFCGIVGILLNVFSNAVAEDAPAESETVSASSAVEQLHTWMGGVRSVHDHLYKEELAVGDLVFAHEFDSESLIEFVRTGIRFQQYPGLMRGPRGTLAVRAGNALDQAVLLAKLLGDAGAEARIVRGTLNDHQVNDLLGQMLRPEARQIVFREGAFEAIRRLAELAGVSDVAAGRARVEEAESELRGRASQIRDSLSRALTASGISMDPVAMPDRIRMEASDYFWVQHRMGPGDEWRSVHPAFEVEPRSFASIQPEEYLASSVPVEFQQRIWLQVRAQRRIGNSVEEVDLTGRWERPAANLLDVVMPIRIVSKGAFGSEPIKEESAEDSRSNEIFVVFFGDSLAPGAKGFTLNGLILDSDAAMSNMAGVFASVSGAGAEGVSALMGLGAASDEAPETAMALESVWLEIGIDIPNQGEGYSTKRWIARSAPTSPIEPADLLKSIEPVVMFGVQALARRLDRELRLHLGLIETSLAQHRAMSADEPYGALIPVLREERRNWQALGGNTLFGEFSEFRTASGKASFFDEPMLILIHRNLSAESESPAGIDIVRNSRRSFSASHTGELLLDRSTTFAAGAWESLAEDRWVNAQTDNGETAAAELLSGEVPRLQVIRSSDELSSVRVSDAARARMGAVLSEARIVLIGRSLAGRQSQSWWDFDPSSGELLGVTSNGWGGGVIFAADLPARVVLDKVTVGITCVMAINVGCRANSKLAIAALQNAFMSGGGPAAIVACEAIMLLFTEGIGPDQPVCATLAAAAQAGGALIAPALRALEQPLYRACFRSTLPRCAELVAATP